MIDFDFALLRPIGLTNSIASELASIASPAPGARLARVTQVQRDWVTLHDGSAACQARPLNRLIKTLQADDTSLAVGDWVVVETHEHDELWIAERIAPVNHIARRGNDGRRQALASNVDTALLVMGLDHDFNPRRLERYLALVEAAQVAPVVVLTKADIGSEVEARMAMLRQRLPARVSVFAVNGLDGNAGQVLAPWLGSGQTLILLGTSGAGKSTLTNALTASRQETGAVRAGDSRGRHTTTSRSLHQCPGGACIIDTPGLRSWRPDADEETLAASFDDIATLAHACQFRDCRHEEEPGCAVRGAVDADRLKNFGKLLREAKRHEETPLERIAAKAKWKVLIKSVQAKNRNR